MNNFKSIGISISYWRLIEGTKDITLSAPLSQGENDIFTSFTVAVYILII